MKFISSFSESEPIRFALKKADAVLDDAWEVSLQQEESAKEQGYLRKVDGKHIELKAGNVAGAMYALLDLAEDAALGMLVNRECIPYLINRGIKFNIPLDARTPSYGDASTSATANIADMWDFHFWEQYLDEMATNKYNVLSLWSLCPFPSMVRIPEYPKAYLDDVKVTTKPFHAKLSGKGIFDEDHRKSLVTVKKIGIDDKIVFWRRVMSYAKDRCIRIFVFTWNVFPYGTEESGYHIDDNPDNPVTRDYIRCGTKALMDTYPLLAGIGVTAGENLTFNGRDDEHTPFEKTDVGFIAETYGKGIREYMELHPERKFTYIHRMQMARYDRIMQAYQDFPCDFEISFKYSQAHMYSSTKPAFIGSFLKEKAPGVKVWLTVRNDDYYMFRWGNPDFAREYLSNMPVSCMNGFYMGPDGFTWGRDYMTQMDEEHELVFQKMWYMFAIWGRLSYDINLDNMYFERMLKSRFGIMEETAAKIYEAWTEASAIIPEFDCTHWHDFDFQWYPEGCCMYYPDPLDKLCFADINEFINCEAMPGTENISVRDYVKLVQSGEEIHGITPIEMAESIESHANRAMSILKELPVGIGKDWERTKKDIYCMSLLGKYFSFKEKAAVGVQLFREGGDKENQSNAVRNLQEASVIWKEYSDIVGNSYIPQVLTRLCGKVDVREFDILTELDICLAEE